MKTIILLICLLATITVPTVSGLPGPATTECVKYHHQSVAAAAGITAVAGDNEIWGDMSGCVVIARSPTEVFRWTGNYNGPVFLAAPIVAWAPGAFNGCTISAIAVSNQFSAVASASQAAALITMTSNECNGLIGFSLSVGGTNIWNPQFSINIRVEQPPYFFHCNAPGITPNAYTPSTTTCTQPTITTQDDSDGWIIHQDEACGATIPCQTNGTSNVMIMGNVTTNQTNLPPQAGEGFDGSLYILLLVFVIVFAHLGEIRGDNVYRIIAGFIMLIASLVSLWELERLGFNNVLHGYGLGFALPFMYVQCVIAVYLMIPKTRNKGETS